jgi:hypothetical protein
MSNRLPDQRGPDMLAAIGGMKKGIVQAKQ